MLAVLKALHLSLSFILLAATYLFPWSGPVWLQVYPVRTRRATSSWECCFRDGERGPIPGCPMCPEPLPQSTRDRRRSHWFLFSALQIISFEKNEMFYAANLISSW